MTTPVDAAPTDDTKPADDATAAPVEVWTPPTQAEWEKTRKDLANANREAKDRREKLAELTRASEDADGKVAREQAEAAEARYKPVAVKAAAKAAFLEAGLAGASPEKLSKLSRLLDLDAITVTDDGDVAGLDEQVAALKVEFPEMFAAVKTRAPRLDAGDKQPAGGASKSSADLIAAQVLGSAA